jgi:preprotein translocase subunit SecA
MRLFARSGPIGTMLEKSMEEDEELAHPWLNRSIESAQKKVEQHNYSIRKRLLQYDDVLNRQREIVYGLRNEALKNEVVRDLLFEFIHDELERRVEVVESGDRVVRNNATHALLGWVNLNFPIALMQEDLEESLLEGILSKIVAAYGARVKDEDSACLSQLERYLIVYSIDKNWQNHLTEMEDLRQSVNLRSYGQSDPLNEYKTEAYRFFEDMMSRVRQGICRDLFRNVDAAARLLAHGAGGVQFRQEGVASSSDDKVVELPKPERRVLPKVGRNDPCPCGSGKKFKKCCGAVDGV